jgi:hypothetical protein
VGQAWQGPRFGRIGQGGLVAHAGDIQVGAPDAVNGAVGTDRGATSRQVGPV